MRAGGGGAGDERPAESAFGGLFFRALQIDADGGQPVAHLVGQRRREFAGRRERPPFQPNLTFAVRG